MKTKKILKQALTLLLTLLMLLSTTSLGLSAAQVELANTGYSFANGTIIYFDTTGLGWPSNYKVEFMIGHNTWSATYEMTKVSNTNLYRYQFTGAWDGCTQFCFIANSSAWGDEGNSPSHRAPYASYKTAVKNINGNYSGSFYGGTDGSLTHQSSVSGFHSNQIAWAYGAEAGSSSYSEMAAAGTVKVAGYYISGTSSTSGSSRSATSSGSSASATASLVKGSTVTLTATPSNGYNFVGWYDSSGTQLSTNATYSYSQSGAKTTYAYFQKQVVNYSYTVTAGEGGTVNTTGGEVVAGESVSLKATPNTGYTFDEWTFTKGTGTTTSATTSFKPTADGATAVASFKKNTYTVTSSVSNAAGGSVSPASTTVEHGGSVTFTAVVNEGYALEDWTVDGVSQGFTNNSFTLTNIVKNNVSVVAVINQVPTYTVKGVVGSGQGSVSPTQQSIKQTSSIKYSAAPDSGYIFSHWVISGSYTGTIDVNSPTFEVTPTADNFTATAHFVKVWTVTFKGMDGTVLKTQTEVVDGTAATAPTAPAVEHYTFTNWDTDFSNVKSDLTVNAVYTGKTYTVTLNTATGGTAATTASSVTYPDTVTLTANPDTENGYVFTGWDIDGAYEGSSTSESITITPKANLKITPKFAKERKLTVYTNSADGYKNLTLTANNTNIINNEAQETTTFNDINWTTSGVQSIPLDATSVTAQLSGTGGSVLPEASEWYNGTSYLTVEGYRTLVFTRPSEWNNYGDVYLYAWTGSGSTNKAWPGEKMHKANNNPYGQAVYVMLIPDDYTSVIFNVNNNNANPKQTVDISVSSVDYEAYYKDSTTDGKYTVGSWKNDINTYQKVSSSDVITLTDKLFKDGAWLGEDEVWIYQSGTNEIVTLRRDLLDLVADTTEEYNGGINTKDYTASSWTAFVEAYEDAKSVSGAGASTQTQIDDAEDALREAYGNLELQAYYTVNFTQNFAGSATIGTTSFTDLTKSVNVVQGSSVSLRFVAPTNYYIVSVKINGVTVETDVTDTTKAWTFVKNYTFTQDSTIEVIYAPNPTLSYQENGATGGTVTFSGNQVSNKDGKVTISYGFNATLNITAPDLYYIQSVLVNGQTAYSGNDESKTTLDEGYVIQNVTSDTTVVITYAKRATHTVTIRNYDTTKGSLTYNNAVLNPGDVIEVLAGEDVTIVAKPNTGFGVSTWGVDDTSYSDRTEYTFSSISGNHEIDVQWIELLQIDITITARPGSAGKATATNGTLTASSDGTRTITVEQYNEITLTATVTDGAYEFVNWSIDGAYTIVSGSRNSATLVIKPSSALTIVANYTQVYKKIYLNNVAGWTQPYIHYWGGSEGSDWPGVPMVYDATSGYWVGYIAEDSTGIQFNDGTNQNEQEPGISTVSNLYNNSTKIWGKDPYVEPGYYLQGKWNGKTFSGYDLQKFTDNGDGTYTFTVYVTSTTDGYIYVNPTNEKSHFWNAATNGATESRQFLTPTGAYTSTPNYVKVEIDTTNYQAAYDVTFTFNPSTGEFSWTKSAHVPTITVTITDGRGENSADTTGEPIASNRVGDSWFDEETVNSFVAHSTSDTAQVVAGSAVTFYTQVDQNSAGGYDYYVAGWVLNGTEFISATSVGNGLYRGAYVFNNEGAVLVPVYFHTNEWLAANNVQTVTVYAVNKDNNIANWNNYMSVYTWYKVGETTKYEQFGAYTGQLMIPVTGLDGVYYTYIETSAPDGTKISGVTFNNHGNASNGYDVSPIVDYSHLQTYDYYEFVSLLNNDKHNITFVLKNTNTTYNSNRVNTTSVTLSDFTFEQYTDYSGLKTDIFGNDIESINSGLLDSNALYIIQAGDKTVYNDTLAGQWYVECYLYTASGTYIGKCYSYELHDENSEIWDLLSAYENQRAYISYEAMNIQRYDGEWYGDAKGVSVTINLAVKVALMGNDGKYTIDADGEVNLADYGKAYINALQNVDVSRGTTVSLSAMPLTGYKFVGWYSADGKLFDTNLNSSAMAAIGTYYVAVFEPLAEGTFYVNHYIYTGLDVKYYIPIVHGGNAQLYVGIKNVNDGTTTTLLQGNSAGLAATEGDKLLITIATDAFGADKFYAWYTDAVDKNGLANFEEVGVDSLDNLAFSDPTSDYYMNGISTVVGSIDKVFFQFEYIVGGDEDDFVLNFYSDLQPVSDDITLVYQYTDRYGNAKQYVVPYKLTDDEIKGFEGNNFEEFTPAYISSTDGSWINTILANAPSVEDYFKDTTWKINSAMFDTMTFLLWATQPETRYTVTTTVTSEAGSEVIVNQVPYNTVIDLDIRELVPDASYTGFWYNDVNNNSVYDKTIDIILTYGPYYGYRVTQDMAINYQKVDSAEDYKFNVSLDAPVYGREQTTDKDGNNKTDVIVIDYVINVLTPYFYYQHPEFTPIYDGKEITDEDWSKTLVTIESLKEAGYKVEFGILLEQVGTFDIDSIGWDAAYAAAQAKGYETASDEAALKALVASGKNGWVNGANSTYGTMYDASTHNITNKNRVLYVLEMNNKDTNWNRFYNVYSYLKVTAPGADTAEIYISNVQTLNIYNAGHTPASVDNNTSFV